MVKKTHACLDQGSSLRLRDLVKLAGTLIGDSVHAMRIIMAVGDPVIGWQYINENLNFEKNTKGGSVSLEGRPPPPPQRANKKFLTNKGRTHSPTTKQFRKTKSLAGCSSLWKTPSCNWWRDFSEGQAQARAAPSCGFLPHNRITGFVFFKFLPFQIQRSKVSLPKS